MYETILIVEQNQDYAAALKRQLEKHGFIVHCAMNGKDALKRMRTVPPSAIILEWDLEDMEGIDVCKSIRQQSLIPIIMISERQEELDIVLALELGATDYISKPFGFRELLTRLKMHLKRHQRELDYQNREDNVTIGPFKVNYDSFKLFKDDVEIPLTYSEFKLFTYLMSNPKKIVSREELIEMLELTSGDRRTVDVHIRRLREKIEEVPGSPKWIKTKNGAGYYFSIHEKELRTLEYTMKTKSF